MALNNRGGIYNRKGNYDLAIADYSQIIEVNPGALIAYINRGRIYDRKGDYDLAIADFSQVIKINQEYEYFLIRGLCYRKNGDYNLALIDFTEAIKLNSKNYNIYIRRGLTYRLLFDYELAMKDFETALQIQPNNSIAKKNLEQILSIIEGNHFNFLENLQQGVLSAPEEERSIHRLLLNIIISNLENDE